MDLINIMGMGRLMLRGCWSKIQNFRGQSPFKE